MAAEMWTSYVEELKSKCPRLSKFELSPYRAPIFYLTPNHYYEYDDNLIFSHEMIKMKPSEATSKFGVKMQEHNYGFLRISPDLFMEFDTDQLTITYSFTKYT